MGLSHYHTTTHCRRLTAKIFKSPAWEARLQNFASTFIQHRQALLEDLAMHASLTAARTSTQLDVVLLLRQLQSPIERKLWKFVQSHGGPERFLENDQLMAELQAQIPPSLRFSSTFGADSSVSKQEVLTEIRTTTSEELRAQEGVFFRKFDLQQENTQRQMESGVKRVGDRIVSEMRMSVGMAYERLVDPVRCPIGLSICFRLIRLSR